MTMRPATSMALPLWLLLLAACQPTVPSVGKATGAVVSKARLSVLCDGTATDAASQSCAPASLGFQDRFVHVLGTKDLQFALQLRCLEPDAQRAFYGAAQGQRVGLFAGEKRLQEFSVPSVAGRTLPECGYVAMPDLDSTLAACEALAKSWDLDPAQCTTLCPAPGPNDEPICIEHY
jgi:hypothetical protein